MVLRPGPPARGGASAQPPCTLAWALMRSDGRLAQVRFLEEEPGIAGIWSRRPNATAGAPAPTAAGPQCASRLTGWVRRRRRRVAELLGHQVRPGRQARFHGGVERAGAGAAGAGAAAGRAGAGRRGAHGCQRVGPVPVLRSALATVRRRPCVPHVAGRAGTPRQGGTPRQILLIGTGGAGGMQRRVGDAELEKLKAPRRPRARQACRRCGTREAAEKLDQMGPRIQWPGGAVVAQSGLSPGTSSCGAELPAGVGDARRRGGASGEGGAALSKAVGGFLGCLARPPRRLARPARRPVPSGPCIHAGPHGPGRQGAPVGAVGAEPALAAGRRRGGPGRRRAEAAGRADAGGRAGAGTAGGGCCGGAAGGAGGSGGGAAERGGGDAAGGIRRVQGWCEALRCCTDWA